MQSIKAIALLVLASTGSACARLGEPAAASNAALTPAPTPAPTTAADARVFTLVSPESDRLYCKDHISGAAGDMRDCGLECCQAACQAEDSCTFITVFSDGGCRLSNPSSCAVVQKAPASWKGVPAIYSYGLPAARAPAPPMGSRLAIDCAWDACPDNMDCLDNGHGDSTCYPEWVDFSDTTLFPNIFSTPSPTPPPTLAPTPKPTWTKAGAKVGKECADVNFRSEAESRSSENWKCFFSYDNCASAKGVKTFMFLGPREQGPYSAECAACVHDGSCFM